MTVPRRIVAPLNRIWRFGGAAADLIESTDALGAMQLRATAERLGSQSITTETTAIPPEPY